MLLLRMFCCFCLLTGIAASGSGQSPVKTIRFGGYDWVVRGSGRGGPGPNAWSPENVWLDKAGNLHLKIRRIRVPATATTIPNREEWQCAELYTTRKLQYGVYEFQVVGPVDRLDPHVVLGLFDYPAPGDGEDGTNEIDIEFARWGNSQAANGNYTVYPGMPDRPMNAPYTFRFQLRGDPAAAVTIHRFTRQPEGIAFESQQIFQNKTIPLAKWYYAAPFRTSLPQKPLPVHINLWLFQGRPPANGKELEIIIRKFSFTPQP